MKRFTIEKFSPSLEDLLSSPSYEPQPFSSDFIPPCDYFPNCKDSKVNIGLNKWYDSDYFKERVKGYEIEYPDRELFLADLNKKIYYTIDCINRLIGKQNGENAIIEYIMYIFFSFGSTGTKQNIGWHFYFLYLHRLLPNVKAIRNGDITVQKRVDEINDFLSEHIHGKSGKINEERRQLATKAAEKWVKTFPFELDVIKEYKFSPSYPVFTITQNPYNPQVGSIYYHNESEVLKSLIRQTNELISKIDLYELAKKGIISSDNIKEVEFDFSHKKYTLEINRIANKYETGELEYVETLEKWLAASEKHFEYLKKYLSKPQSKPQTNDTPTTRTNTKKPKPTPKTFADIFINDDWSKYIDVLCEVEPILLKKDDNGKYVFAGNPKKHKGVICSWIKDLQDKNIIHFENRQNLSLVLNAEIKEFNLGKDGKTFDNASSDYRKNYQNTLLKRVGLLP